MAPESVQKSSVPLTCHGHSRPVPHLSFSGLESDGNYYMISACKDGNPMLRDGQTGDWIGTFLGHKGAVWQAKLSPDTASAATASADFSARVWDTHSGELRFNFQHEHIVRAIAYPFDNSTMIATGGQEKILRVWDLIEDTGKPIQAHIVGDKHPDNIKFIVWPKNALRLVTAAGNTLRWFDLPSRKCIREESFSAEIKSCELVCLAAKYSTGNECGGGEPVMCVAAGNKVAFFTGSGVEHKIKELELPHGVASVSLDLHSKRIVVGEEPGTWARVYDWDGNEIEICKGHHGPIWSIAFSPDNKLFATGSEDGTIKLWKNCEGDYSLWRGGSLVPATDRTE